MGDGKQSANGSLFGNLDWIYAFRSDAARLAAIALVCATLVAIFALPPALRTWAADRADRREHERKKLALLAALRQQISHRSGNRNARDG